MCIELLIDGFEPRTKNHKQDLTAMFMTKKREMTQSVPSFESGTCTDLHKAIEWSL